MTEHGSCQGDAPRSPLELPDSTPPPGPDGDLALRRACQCFGEALGRFTDLRRSASVDAENADQSDATHLVAARTKWSCALAELRSLRATTWGGLQARYEAWVQLSPNSVRTMAGSSNWPWIWSGTPMHSPGRTRATGFQPGAMVRISRRPTKGGPLSRASCLVSVRSLRCSR